MLNPGTRLGPYEISALLGIGGMGEVYQATDTNLKRQVAIKVLPTSVAGDAERVARFQREAEVLAALNHPNIAHIHGLEKADGTIALVMELVEGPTLADRVATGAIPIDEGLPIARQIAEALEAAHEQGIIHRDLKPANIKVRDDGTVKVLDFGLAKFIEPTAAGAVPTTITESPTITSPAMTQVGMILGTAAYMSPEQARGKPADTRSDLWAFGCVLYEMLTGRRAFTALTVSHHDSDQREGEQIADVLAAVLTRTPDWSPLPAWTPDGVRRLLHRCLERDRRHRLQSAADVRILLEDAIAEPREARVAASASRSRGLMAVMLALLVVVVILSVPVIKYVGEVAPALPETRTDIVTPPTTDRVSFALSPDGLQLAFAGENNGRLQLWLRPLASSVAQPLAGTEGGAHPFWSADGASLAFFAAGKLQVLDLASRRVRPLADVRNARGGTWNAAGVLLFPPRGASPLFRTTAAGEAPRAVTKLDQQQGHIQPQFLPDGRHFIFFANGNPDHAGVYVGTLDSDVVNRLTPAEGAGVFLPTGWLVWPRDGTLWAQPVDVARGALMRNPIALAGSIAIEGLMSAISASANGLIAFRAGVASRRQLQWFDRHGESLGTLGDPDESDLSDPRVSPDGRLVAVYRSVKGNSDLWLFDGPRATPLTTKPAEDRLPTWSPDGSAVIFESNRSGTRQLYMKQIGINSPEEPILPSKTSVIPQSWSADGRFLLYDEIENGNYDLWALPLIGERRPFPVLTTEFTEKGAEFSPDGRWIAYMSDHSGQSEIYVRRFILPGSPEAAEQRDPEVSTAGGIYPKWARDGSELYYLAPDGTLMAVPVRMTTTSFEKGTPVPLFPTRIVGGGLDNEQGNQYDVAPDGRFLINTVLDDTTPITLIQNWMPPRTP
jgi:Tol biopolymer transport system component